MKFNEDIVRYNIKFPFHIRRALNRAIARRIFALPNVLLSELPSTNHIIIEIMANNLGMSVPPIKIETDIDRTLTVMFQTPSRIKRAFAKLCEDRGQSQNKVINSILSKSTFAELEARVTVSSDLPKEHGQGFTCRLEGIHKVNIFKRCAEKIMLSGGRRQWGIADMINIMLAAETGEPLSTAFFEESDMADDKIFEMLIAMPLSMHTELFRRVEAEGTTAAKMINGWIADTIKMQGI